jgi:hypothetical protein
MLEISCKAGIYSVLAAEKHRRGCSSNVLPCCLHLIDHILFFEVAV